MMGLISAKDYVAGLLDKTYTTIDTLSIVPTVLGDQTTEKKT